MPRSAVIRSMVLNHIVHHRAHTIVYIRLTEMNLNEAAAALERSSRTADRHRAFTRAWLSAAQRHRVTKRTAAG
jgi:hypothetical protein